MKNILLCIGLFFSSFVMQGSAFKKVVPAPKFQQVVIKLDPTYRITRNECFALWKSLQADGVSEEAFSDQWRSKTFSFRDEIITMPDGSKSKSVIKFTQGIIASEVQGDYAKQLADANRQQSILGKPAFLDGQALMQHRLSDEGPGVLYLTPGCREAISRLVAQDSKPELMLAKFSKTWQIAPGSRDAMNKHIQDIKAREGSLK